MPERRVVIVGASLAGARGAQALRQNGFDGEITVIGAEQHLPYDRPPLSKQFLSGEWDVDRLGLWPDDAAARYGLDVRLGRRATGLDVAGSTVALDDGEPLTFDHLVIATGSHPRRLDGLPELSGVHELRTLDDAVALRDGIAQASALVVVGAGFIGSEVAATARGRGLEVTVLEALPIPLGRALGPQLGPAVAALHTDHGVEVRLGAAVAGLVGKRSVEGVTLADGTAVAADLVVVGVGTQPTTGWLAGSGLELRDGVVCDAACRAVGAPGVWAAGDVARWAHPHLGEVRIEHWDNASAQGAAVAAGIVADLAGEAPAPFAPVPFVWSEQYDSMIQVLGRPQGADEVEVVLGSLEARSFVALLSRDAQLTGVVGIDDKRTMRFRAVLRDERPSVERARQLAADLA